jgi:hypothetical protein
VFLSIIWFPPLRLRDANTAAASVNIPHTRHPLFQ